MPSPALHVFGLSGGIGSGKSTVAARFRQRGLPVVDADQLARDAVRPGSPALQELVQAFGEQVLQPDGGLDRPRLASLVFADQAQRQRLNRITHPRVHELSVQRFAALAQAGHALACYEVPLLVESGLQHGLRPLVLAWVPLALQLQRTMQRDQCSEAAALARIHAQMPLGDKVALADYVIDNSGELEASWAQADQVLDAISQALKLPAQPPAATATSQPVS